MRELITKHVDGAGQVRPRGAAELHRRQRRRAASPTRTRRSPPRRRARRSTTSIPGPDDLDREPDRGRRSRAPRRGQGVRRLRALPSRRSSTFADWGYRPVDQAVLDEEQGEVPDAAGPVHDRRPRRLGEGQRRVLRPGQGLGRRRSRRTRGSPLPSEAADLAAPPAARRRAAPPRRRAARAARARHRDAVAERHRPAPARRRRRAVDRRRPRRVLGRGHEPPGGRGAAADAARCRSSSRRSTRSSGRSIAWVLVRDRFRGKRRRQRAHRPAVRAADDRRRPRRCSRSTARTARSASTSRSRARRSLWRCCS